MKRIWLTLLALILSGTLALAASGQARDLRSLGSAKPGKPPPLPPWCDSKNNGETAACLVRADAGPGCFVVGPRPKNSLYQVKRWIACPPSGSPTPAPKPKPKPKPKPSPPPPPATTEPPPPPKEPPRRPKVVPIKSVSNGCGGEGTPEWITEAVNKQDFLGGYGPRPRSYRVDFVDACNLHDACYSGAAVKDKLHHNVVDFSRWSKGECDDKILTDLRDLCDQQIPSKAELALGACYTRGGPEVFSFGAESLHDTVRKFGERYFDADPETPGIQHHGNGPRNIN